MLNIIQIEARKKDIWADQYIQIKKVASEITAKQFFWMEFISALYVETLVYPNGFDRKSW